MIAKEFPIIRFKCYTDKYLIFRADRIGDFLVSAILIKSIKSNDQKSHITIIASKKNYEYIKNFPYVDEVIKLENRMPKRLNKITTLENPIIFLLFFFNSRLYFMGKF